MIISPTNNFIFFKSLKTAGSSVEYALHKACGPDDLMTGGTSEEREQGFLPQNNSIVNGNTITHKFHSHTWPEMLFKRSSAHLSMWDNFHKATTVRNPWDLCVSAYWWTLHAHPSEWLRIHDSDTRKKAQWKFKAFLDAHGEHESMWPEKEEASVRQLDYWSQTALHFLHPCIDTYIRFESITGDYHDLCSTLNITPHNLPYFKSSQRKLRHHYSYYYDDESRSMIAHAFQDLIAKFGYEFECK
tara:strand:+ start:556 stop:1287 length:732 start_codon:yes stop_codon:yes gene_type:complete